MILEILLNTSLVSCFHHAIPLDLYISKIFLVCVNTPTTNMIFRLILPIYVLMGNDRDVLHMKAREQSYPRSAGSL